LGYDHPPQVAGDVNEAGIAITTKRDRVSAKTGHKTGVYRFGDPSDIKAGRIDGRKAFKQRLVDHCGSRKAFTQGVLAPRYLQIDHRVRYRLRSECWACVATPGSDRSTARRCGGFEPDTSIGSPQPGSDLGQSLRGVENKRFSSGVTGFWDCRGLVLHGPRGALFRRARM